MSYVIFFFQAEDGIRDLVRSRGLGDVYKRQVQIFPIVCNPRRLQGAHSAERWLCRAATRHRTRSVLEPIPGPEHPEDHAQTQRKEQRDRGDTHVKPDIALPEKGPSEAADQIDDGVEQGDRAPCRGQHVERIKRAAQEGERIDHELSLIHI